MPKLWTPNDNGAALAAPSERVSRFVTEARVSRTIESHRWDDKDAMGSEKTVNGAVSWSKLLASVDPERHFICDSHFAFELDHVILESD